jgi:Holliday junction resolvase RusA-like endonuclease
MSALKTIVIVVPGAPMGKPRMTRSDKWKRRECVLRYRAYADAIRLCVRNQIGKLPRPEQIKKLNWTAYFEPPVSWNKTKRQEALGQLHRSKPDRDNLDKAVLDSLFDEDSAIASGHIEKRWGLRERLEIVIEYETDETAAA